MGTSPESGRVPPPLADLAGWRPGIGLPGRAAVPRPPPCPRARTPATLRVSLAQSRWHCGGSPGGDTAGPSVPRAGKGNPRGGRLRAALSRRNKGGVSASTLGRGPRGPRGVPGPAQLA